MVNGIYPREEAHRIHEILGHGIPELKSMYAHSVLAYEKMDEISSSTPPKEEWSAHQAHLFLAYLGLFIASDYKGTDANAYELFEALDDILLYVAQFVFRPVTYSGRAKRRAPYQPIPGPTLDTTGPLATEIVMRLTGYSVNEHSNDFMRGIGISDKVLTDEAEIELVACDMCRSFEHL